MFMYTNMHKTIIHVDIMSCTSGGAAAASIGSSSYPISLPSIFLLDFKAFSKEVDLRVKPRTWASGKLPKKLQVKKPNKL